MADVFVSYRRETGRKDARALYESLTSRLGAGTVFMDVESVEPGSRWLDKMAGELAKSTVVLVVIGPSWLEASDHRGRQRLGQPDDVVRLEVHLALSLGKLVIPVLFDGAAMPSAEELPNELRRLADLQAKKLSHDHFTDHVGDLETLIRRALEDPSGWLEVKRDLQGFRARSRAFALNQWGYCAAMAAGYILFGHVVLPVIMPEEDFYLWNFNALTLFPLLFAFHPMLLAWRIDSPVFGFRMLGKFRWWEPPLSVAAIYLLNEVAASLFLDLNPRTLMSTPMLLVRIGGLAAVTLLVAYGWQKRQVANEKRMIAGIVAEIAREYREWRKSGD